MNSHCSVAGGSVNSGSCRCSDGTRFYSFLSFRGEQLGRFLRLLPAEFYTCYDRLKRSSDFIDCGVSVEIPLSDYTETEGLVEATGRDEVCKSRPIIITPLSHLPEAEGYRLVGRFFWAFGYWIKFSSPSEDRPSGQCQLLLRLWSMVGRLWVFRGRVREQVEENSHGNQLR